ncbi:Retrovirus-related Pol polyprotein from transposon 412 [Araneus ventricosus]|uniref:RNA-directed DNA polymerase n=1 Tax=Araneus ventricosus TaxID=182803 RepID=A0A4Y2JZ08_ARAVE|nr:Retrovirus-related Pol polyprotein from transposon 412 [Araneus ventricosus]
MLGNEGIEPCFLQKELKRRGVKSTYFSKSLDQEARLHEEPAMAGLPCYGVPMILTDQETVHDLRSFLGLCTYYRRFVRNLSAIARSLHKLTEARLNFNWTEECEKSFNSLKQSLITSPVLTYPRTDKEFILDTDASNEGIGDVLSQKIGNEGCVIAYFSKSLGKPEINYCVKRKELLGIMKSIEHFHHYLYERKFLLRIDHASLRWLLNFTEPEGQIARWIQRFQEYDFEIQDRRGNAEALSRRPVKRAANIARMSRKSSEFKQTFP